MGHVVGGQTSWEEGQQQIDSGGAPERTKQSGEEAGVQGRGTKAAGTGGSSRTGITSCTGGETLVLHRPGA